jgi:hypothetical protein
MLMRQEATWRTATAYQRRSAPSGARPCDGRLGKRRSVRRSVLLPGMDQGARGP